MKKVKKIANRFILLLIDLLVFTYHIVRKVILPTRRRKGNILSSLLSFFTGLIERIVSFEKSILRQPIVFNHKYVRQALVLAAGFLFLLSSLEWTVEQAHAVTVHETQVVVNKPANAVHPFAAQGSVIASVQNQTRNHFDADLAPSILLFSGGPHPEKKWLRHCILRI